MTELADLVVASLGEPRYLSPLAGYVAGRRSNDHYVDEDDRVLLPDTLSLLASSPATRPSFEPGGSRASVSRPRSAPRRSRSTRPWSRPAPA